nr:unnamed protein product [Spirometra erinaceieuropaei]
MILFCLMGSKRHLEGAPTAVYHVFPPIQQRFPNLSGVIFLWDSAKNPREVFGADDGDDDDDGGGGCGGGGGGGGDGDGDDDDDDDDDGDDDDEDGGGGDDDDDDDDADDDDGIRLTLGSTSLPYKRTPAVGILLSLVVGRSMHQKEQASKHNSLEDLHGLTPSPRVTSK